MREDLPYVLLSLHAHSPAGTKALRRPEFAARPAPDRVGVALTGLRQERSTMQITTIGLDLAKHWFQVHGVDANGHIVVRRRLWRTPRAPPSYGRRPLRDLTGDVSRSKAPQGRVGPGESSISGWTPTRERSLPPS